MDIPYINKESDTTEWLNWTEVNWTDGYPMYQHCLLRRLYFPHLISLASLWKSIKYKYQSLFLDFELRSIHWSICLFLCHNYTVLITVAYFDNFIIHFVIGKFSNLILYKNSFCYSETFAFLFPFSD